MNRHVRLGAFAATAITLGILATACGDDDAFLSDADTAASGEVASSVGTTGDRAEAAPRAQQYSASPGTGGEGGESGESVTDPFARKIIFNAAMNLETDDVRAAFAAAGRVAVLRGGFVEQSSLSGAAEERQSASVTLRVPAESYPDALQDIRQIEGVEVTSENASSAEVTEEYTDLESRLRNLERTESQYLDLMAKATTIDDILTVSDRLEGVRLQIEQVQGRINYLDNLTGMATIDVAILETAPVSVEESGGTSIGEAFADAWELSLEVAKSFAVAAAYLAVAAAWIAIPAGVVLLAVRRFRRHAHPAATGGEGQASA